MDFPDPRRTPTISEVVAGAMAARLRDVHTGIPGVVTKVTQVGTDNVLVDVKPTVQSYLLGTDGTPQLLALPVVSGVPIAYQGAGGFRITFPIQEGDSCRLCPQEGSLDAWFESDGKTDVDPQDVRRFNLQDSVAVFDVRTRLAKWSNISPTAMTVGADAGPQAVFRGTQIELGGTDSAPPTDFVALASLVMSNLNALAAVFTAWTPTGVPADTTDLKTLLTALISGSPTPPPWPYAVAASKVLAE